MAVNRAGNKNRIRSQSLQRVPNPGMMRRCRRPGRVMKPSRRIYGRLSLRFLHFGCRSVIRTIGAKRIRKHRVLCFTITEKMARTEMSIKRRKQLPAHRMGFDPSVRRSAGTKEIPEGVFLTDCLRLGSPSAERRGSAGGSGRGPQSPLPVFRKRLPGRFVNTCRL